MWPSIHSIKHLLASALTEGAICNIRLCNILVNMPTDFNTCTSTAETPQIYWYTLLWALASMERIY